MNLEELYLKRKALKFTLEVKVNFLLQSVFALPTIIEVMFFLENNHRIPTTTPLLFGWWFIFLPISMHYRGELIKTEKEMSDLLSHITNVREQMKAHWHETKKD